MADEIQERIHRIYAAIGAIEESNSENLRAEVFQCDNAVLVFQGFRGGQSDSALMNQATILIYNIANLDAHLKPWADKNGLDKAEVTQVFDGCRELKIIKDLSNNDRHPYPPRNGGHSGLSPKLVEINRVMRLQTQAKAGSWCAMQLGADGRPIFSGDGTHKAVVTGHVVDENNTLIGDLYEIAMTATKAWEKFVIEHGLLQSNQTQ
jgi:hypothetical protein